MDRRAFVLAITGGALARPLAVRAQTLEKKVYRIGFLRVGTAPIAPAFTDEMRRLGWIERQNLTIEPRYAQKEDQLPALAGELARLKVDLILTTGTPATRAAKQATQTIPIVFNVGSDPVAAGLVASLGRPGGNVTGFAFGIYEEKLLEALKDVYPKAVRFVSPFPAVWQKDPGPPDFLAAANALGLQHQGIPIDGPNDLARIFATARDKRADVVVFFDIAWPFAPHLDELASESVKNRMPAIFQARQFVEAGGLMSYGPVMVQHWPRLADQIDKILKGAKPADLPVEQPTRFELAINLKTAKALGIAISQSALVRADEVIR
jgi:putative tryptophan/tyrosine transport system substrate-binding protein